MAMALGRVGVWTRYSAWDSEKTTEAAVELENLGYGTLWLGATDPDLRLVDGPLAATSRLVVASGIVNVWAVAAPDLAANFHRVTKAHPGRFLLGLGASHAPSVERLGKAYTRPLRYVADYLGALDSAPEPVPADQRALAALGPKMLELAARRTAGAHPYLVTPDHTRRARETLGAGPLLAPEQKVVLATDPTEARAVGRTTLRYYLKLPNYVRNLLTLGFDHDDVAGEGSDRLVDAMIAWGSADQVAKRVREHHDAGADHVAIQVVQADVTAPPGSLPRQQWRELAAALA